MNRSPLFAGLLFASLLSGAFAMAGEPAPKGDAPIGFADARDEEMEFHLHKNPRNAVNVLSKAPGETIKMAAKQFSGQIKLNPAKLDSAAGVFAVPFNNLEMPKKQMKQHLLGPRWIDADKFPDAKFTVTGIEKAVAKNKTVAAHLKGKMSIHGLDKDVSIPVTMLYTKDAKADGKNDTLIIRGTFGIALADYNISGMGVGKKVAETMKLTVNINMSTGEESAAGEGKPKPPHKGH